MFGLTHISDAKNILQLCFSIVKLIERFRSQDQHSQVCSMSHAHQDVPATCILTGQITDHTRNPTRTAPIEHPKNSMETVMESFKSRDIANLGRTLTKDTADQNILWDKCMDNLLTHTNKQIEPSTLYSKYPHTKANSSINSNISSSNQHTQTWTANQPYRCTLSSQPESCTLTCTHNSVTNWLRNMASSKNTATNCTTTSVFIEYCKNVNQNNEHLSYALAPVAEAGAMTIRTITLLVTW